MATGERVRALREQRALTQQQLAAKAGLSVATIARTESGRRAPHQGTLLLIASALETTVDDLQRAS